MASFLLSYKKKILEVQKRALQVEETNARSRAMKVDAKLIIEECRLEHHGPGSKGLVAQEATWSSKNVTHDLTYLSSFVCFLGNPCHLTMAYEPPGCLISGTIRFNY
jgi:hypothetical protein